MSQKRDDETMEAFAIRQIRADALLRVLDELGGDAYQGAGYSEDAIRAGIKATVEAYKRRAAGAAEAALKEACALLREAKEPMRWEEVEALRGHVEAFLAKHDKKGGAR